MPRNVGSATKDGAVEGISVNTQAELSGADVRTLAELTAKVPNQLSIKRSGKGVRILVS